MAGASNKKRAVKAFIVFLAIMALMTYISRTLYLYTLPRVKTGYPTGSRLYITVEPSAFKLDSERIESVYVNADLSAAPLSVSDIHVSRCASVRAGDPLVSFDPAQGVLALEDASRQADEAMASLEVWDTLHEAELADEQRKLEEDIAALSYADDIDDKAAELRARRGELEAHMAAGTENNPERLPLANALYKADAVKSALLELSENDWTVCAAEDCVIAEVRVSSGDTYPGALPLCMVIPSGADTRAGFDVHGAPYEEDTASVSVIISSKEAEGWTYDSRSPGDEGETVWFISENETALNKLSGASLMFITNRYQYVVPNSAVRDGSVYVLQTRDAAFGGQEDYAVAVNLSRTLSDDNNTAVLNGLDGSDIVILSWDRDFGDGDTVIVDN